MPKHLKIEWLSVPLSTEVILENNLTEVGIYARAIGLLFSDRSAQDFSVLVEKVGDWARQSVDVTNQQVADILHRTMNLHGGTLLAEGRVPAPKLRTITKAAPAPAPTAGIQWITPEELQSIIERNPRLPVKSEYDKAVAWYRNKSIPLTEDAFMRWIHRVKEAASKKPMASGPALTLVPTCQRCNGTGSYLQDDNGIPVPTPCYH